MNLITPFDSAKYCRTTAKENLQHLTTQGFLPSRGLALVAAGEDIVTVGAVPASVKQNEVKLKNIKNRSN